MYFDLLFSIPMLILWKSHLGFSVKPHQFIRVLFGFTGKNSTTIFS